MVIPVTVGDFQGFAVSPKADCPHQYPDHLRSASSFLEANPELPLHSACHDCQSTAENWLCLSCNQVGCSQYVGGHLKAHAIPQKHPVALSFSDGSFWCYECDSYVTSPELSAVALLFSKLKHGEQDLAQTLSKLSVKQKPQPPAQDLIIKELCDQIKQGKYKKVVFMTGAGISVKAGIPDFRTPGTGLYSQLEKYKLPRPEAVFTLQFFKTNPFPFYDLSKEFLTAKPKPVTTHHFITRFDKQGLLKLCLTQNIDGLQLDAGLPLDKLIQAHGHYRTCHCIGCKKEYDPKQFQKAIDQQQPLRCACGSLVKPDIVFFGQQMPAYFFSAFQAVGDCDLVFVMGTSLKVFPFAALVDRVPKSARIVLVNRQNALEGKDNAATLLLGDIDQIVEQMTKELGW